MMLVAPHTNAEAAFRKETGVFTSDHEPGRRASIKGS